jgi:hypothetical protein
MNLKQNNKDPRLLEDEFGNPMFKYVGDHPRDVERLLNYIEGLEEMIDDLEADITYRDEHPEEYAKPK